MCLAIPGKIQSIRHEYDGRIRMAKISFGGIIKDATLDMVPTAEVGDYVLVHVGVAISIVDEAEAKRVFEYLEAMGETDELREGDYQVPGQVDAPRSVGSQAFRPK
ncbi:HypC/HybG/HupF family hydrogenase formation chaperone [Neolewinella lacunae]|uniref:HypC/HybG/HupF family hydrogenase formation chaperone n=1 Tax=Neolewinella lacunae TaxID=1517758 RepID=A0A923PPM5_9BACT|nr:HypC/HybG/HupF family hydrogenase formation chaperone [Neolewinella lacunae]MBC6995103.1 HypC/HybG/HupF family hydrogenase formation chaperone [Neolewinella lacunae]MDN3634053.1 HypC/HybG/HupF family hydrogenase formation chaperone [Neolewinella lacunae]